MNFHRNTAIYFYHLTFFTKRILGIGIDKREPSGRIGLGYPPYEESNPLRLRIIFIFLEKSNIILE